MEWVYARLWSPGRSDKLKVSMPPTVLVERCKPVLWLITSRDGRILRRSKVNLVWELVYEAFAQHYRQMHAVRATAPFTVARHDDDDDDEKTQLQLARKSGKRRGSVMPEPNAVDSADEYQYDNLPAAVVHWRDGSNGTVVCLSELRGLCETLASASSHMRAEMGLDNVAVIQAFIVPRYAPHDDRPGGKLEQRAVPKFIAVTCLHLKNETWQTDLTPATSSALIVRGASRIGASMGAAYGEPLAYEVMDIASVYEPSQPMAGRPKSATIDMDNMTSVSSVMLRRLTSITKRLFNHLASRTTENIARGECIFTVDQNMRLWMVRCHVMVHRDDKFVAADLHRDDDALYQSAVSYSSKAHRPYRSTMHGVRYDRASRGDGSDMSTMHGSHVGERERDMTGLRGGRGGHQASGLGSPGVGSTAMNSHDFHVNTVIDPRGLKNKPSLAFRPGGASFVDDPVDTIASIMDHRAGGRGREGARSPQPTDVMDGIDVAQSTPYGRQTGAMSARVVQSSGGAIPMGTSPQVGDGVAAAVRLGSAPSGLHHVPCTRVTFGVPALSSTGSEPPFTIGASDVHDQSDGKVHRYYRHSPTTVIPYLVMRGAQVLLSLELKSKARRKEQLVKTAQIAFVVVNDTFGCLSNTMAIFEEVLKFLPRSEVLLFNLPGQPMTEFDVSGDFGNDANALVLEGLMRTLWSSRELLGGNHRRWPLAFVSSGTGAAVIAALLAKLERPQNCVVHSTTFMSPVFVASSYVRSVVPGWMATVESLVSARGVEAFVPGAEGASVVLMTAVHVLFSQEYLQRGGISAGHKALESKLGPWTIVGQSMLLRGVMSSVDYRVQLAGLEVPIIVIHAQQSNLSKEQADSLKVLRRVDYEGNLGKCFEQRPATGFARVEFECGHSIIAEEDVAVVGFLIHVACKKTPSSLQKSEDERKRKEKEEEDKKVALTEELAQMRKTVEETQSQLEAVRQMQMVGASQAANIGVMGGPADIDAAVNQIQQEIRAIFERQQQLQQLQVDLLIPAIPHEQQRLQALVERDSAGLLADDEMQVLESLLQQAHVSLAQADDGNHKQLLAYQHEIEVLNATANDLEAKRVVAVRQQEQMRQQMLQQQQLQQQQLQQQQQALHQAQGGANAFLVNSQTRFGGGTMSTSTIGGSTMSAAGLGSSLAGGASVLTAEQQRIMQQQHQMQAQMRLEQQQREAAQQNQQQAGDLQQEMDRLAVYNQEDWRVCELVSLLQELFSLQQQVQIGQFAPDQYAQVEQRAAQIVERKDALWASLLSGEGPSGERPAAQMAHSDAPNPSINGWNVHGAEEQASGNVQEGAPNNMGRPSSALGPDVDSAVTLPDRPPTSPEVANGAANANLDESGSSPSDVQTPSPGLQGQSDEGPPQHVEQVNSTGSRVMAASGSMTDIDFPAVDDSPENVVALRDIESFAGKSTDSIDIDLTQGPRLITTSADDD